MLPKSFFACNFTEPFFLNRQDAEPCCKIKRAALPQKWLSTRIETFQEFIFSKSFFLLDFVQVVLGCFFVSGLKSFAGCVRRSAKKCRKVRKSARKRKEVQKSAGKTFSED